MILYAHDFLETTPTTPACATRLARILGSLILLLIVACLPARALDDTLRLEDYHHETWSSKQGAPSGITGMAQTRDGWLWLATDNGLYRSDGVRFEPFKPYPGEQLLGRRIGTLYAAPDGDLWIGYITGGVSRLHQGRLQHHSRQQTPLGVPYEITVDTDGTPWVASNNGLHRLRQGKWQQLGAASGLPGTRIENIFLDHHGELWTANGQAVFRFDRTTERFSPTGISLSNGSFDAAPDGSIWVTDVRRVQRLPAPLVPSSQARPDWINQSTSRYGLFDREGSYWSVNCPNGICRIAGPALHSQQVLQPETDATDRLDKHWQLSSINTVAMLEDREGNIWVATWAGLERFRHNKLITYPLPELAGLTELAADADGRLWASSLNKKGQRWLLQENHPPIAAPNPTYVRIAAGMHGSVLMGSDTAIERQRGDVSERIPLPDGAVPPGQSSNFARGVMTMVEDGHSLWTIVMSRGLYRYTDGRWESAEALGLPKSPVFLASSEAGVVWLGYRNNELIRYEHGKQRRFTAKDGLNTGAASYIHSGKDLLVSGDNGSVVLKGERFVTLKTDDPELLVNVSGAVTTPDGDVWLNGAKGLVHVTARDWQAAMANPDQMLRHELFNTLDGYPGRAQNLMRMASALLNTDGKLWVVGNAGIAWLNPGRLHRNPLSPPVYVLGVHTDQQDYPAGVPIELPAGSSSLRIDYTALGYTMPERVRFKYRLEGVDKDWQDAGTRRAAFYTNLAPGDYHFRVVASNEDGVWNTVGDSLNFSIAPTFVQSHLFLALCLCLILLAGYGLYQWRIRQLTSQARIKLTERERIARALHDTLLQGMQATILRFQNMTNRLSLDENEQARAEQILAQADAMLIEGRDQVMELRLSHDLHGDLRSALAEAGACMAADHPATFTMRTDGEPIPLKPAIHDEAYSVAREALSNAFRHAQASHIHLLLVFDPEQLAIHIQDDGKGMDTEILTAGQRLGHWGLSGMRERADRIGARLRINPLAERGTEVTLTVPGKLAYRDRGRRRWRDRLLLWLRH
ncbi:sensor histidine kinase [Chitinimonas naiadis]